jgi:hypothetical protein
MLMRLLTLLLIAFGPLIGAVAQNGTQQQRAVALLDVTQRNAETTDEEVWSATHALKVAGVPFVITESVNEAINYGMVVVSSRIEVSTLNADEADSLEAFVNRGGTLVAGNMRDPELYAVFGLNGEALDNTHHRIRFDLTINDPALKWINDPMEQEISLGDTALPVVINSRYYTLAGGTPIARYEDDLPAIVRNGFGSGMAYALGFSFKNMVIKNLLNQDYEADRTYSNGFEPTTDVVFLLLRGIYQKHIAHGVWLHTSPFNSRAALLVTHDVDARTSYDTMHYYADFEQGAGFSATYLLTTHYVDDEWLSDFYNPITMPAVEYLLDKGHVLGSHSVGHFTDFDSPSVFPLGQLGNNSATYYPYNFGDSTATTNGTVMGETEVSKLLLEQDFGTVCRSFRAGFLDFNPKLINALDTLGYAFNSTFSANDVLTDFPYFNRKDRISSGELSRVLEIPMTISDVNSDNPINAVNYLQWVSIWADVVARNAANNAPTTLLIHPNRQFKLAAEQDLVAQLPQDILVGSLEAYGDYWLARDSVSFGTRSDAPGTVTIVIPSALLPLDPAISFIVGNGQELLNIWAEDENGNPINVLQSPWGAADLIVHFDYSPVLNVHRHTAQHGIVAMCIPNPAIDNAVLSFNLQRSSKVDLSVTDLSGRTLWHSEGVCAWQGRNEFALPINQFAPGVYLYSLHTPEGNASGRLVVAN